MPKCSAIFECRTFGLLVEEPAEDGGGDRHLALFARMVMKKPGGGSNPKWYQLRQAIDHSIRFHNVNDGVSSSAEEIYQDRYQSATATLLRLEQPKESSEISAEEISALSDTPALDAAVPDSFPDEAAVKVVPPFAVERTDGK